MVLGGHPQEPRRGGHRALYAATLASDLACCEALPTGVCWLAGPRRCAFPVGLPQHPERSRPCRGTCAAQRRAQCANFPAPRDHLRNRIADNVINKMDGLTVLGGDFNYVTRDGDR
eukprot:3984256-Pyramimonas_sp.AAC.1